jgi:predicted SprT family Zn-dependent metalloprotease
MLDATAENFLVALRQRGIRRIRRVRFRNNRERLLSLSRDGSLLNAHACFASAPPDIFDAIATFLRARDGSEDSRRAVAALRDWPGTRDALERARIEAEERGTTDGADPPRSAPCCGTSAQQRYLRRLYAQLNRARFSGALPKDLPIRLSNRMETRYGHVRYHVRKSGRREVVELALNVDLMLEANETDLLDTLLHEMAHIEVWLALGHKGHGRPWKRTARRVGCEARACSDRRLRRRSKRELTVTRVPARTFEQRHVESGQTDLFENVA